MEADRFAALMFRFIGIGVIVGFFPTVAIEAVPTLFYSAKFSIGSATDTYFEFIYAVMLALQMLVAIALILLAKRLAAMVLRGI